LLASLIYVHLFITIGNFNGNGKDLSKTKINLAEDKYYSK